MVAADHITFPRIAAAVRAGDLSFLLAHRESLSLATEAEMCRLIAEQRPGKLKDATIDWIRRFAVEAIGQRPDDYIVIVQAFDRFPLRPDVSAGELRALCAARGIEP